MEPLTKRSTLLVHSFRVLLLVGLCFPVHADWVTATVGTGTGPYAVAVNPVTNKIYVTSSGYHANYVTVIDGATNAMTNLAMDLPSAVAVNPVTNKIYVVNNWTVGVIDGATNTTTTVSVGTFPSGVAVNPVTNKIYTTNHDDGNVTVIDGATNATTTVNAGGQPSAVAVNPVTNTIYVANYGSANVTVISDVPYADTKVWAVMDTLPNHTTYLAQPALTGKGVNRLTPYQNRIERVLQHLNTAQNSWNLANIISGSGTDSVRWSWNWGSDSLIKGENFVLAVALESDAATTNNEGLGSPFSGNLTVYPVYRIDQPQVGVVNKKMAQRSSGLGLRIVSTPFASFAVAIGREHDLFNLYNVSGRRVGTYKGEKIGEGLSTGIYFLRQVAGNARPERIVLGR